MELHDMLTSDDVRALIGETVQEIIREELKNGWGKWGVYVTESIKDLLADRSSGHEDHETLQRDISIIRMDLALLKKEMQIKSGVWGLLGGMIPICMALGVWLLQTILSK